MNYLQFQMMRKQAADLVHPVVKNINPVVSGIGNFVAKQTAPYREQLDNYVGEKTAPYFQSAQNTVKGAPATQPANGPYTMADRSYDDRVAVRNVEDARYDNLGFSGQLNKARDTYIKQPIGRAVDWAGEKLNSFYGIKPTVNMSKMPQIKGPSGMWYQGVQPAGTTNSGFVTQAAKGMLNKSPAAIAARAVQPGAAAAGLRAGTGAIPFGPGLLVRRLLDQNK